MVAAAPRDGAHAGSPAVAAAGVCSETAQPGPRALPPARRAPIADGALLAGACWAAAAAAARPAAATELAQPLLQLRFQERVWLWIRLHPTLQLVQRLH